MNISVHRYIGNCIIIEKVNVKSELLFKLVKVMPKVFYALKNMVQNLYHWSLFTS